MKPPLTEAVNDIMQPLTDFEKTPGENYFFVRLFTEKRHDMIPSESRKEGSV